MFIRVVYHLTNSLSLSHIPSHVHAPLLLQPIYVQDLILVWLLSDIRRTKMATCHRNCQAFFHLSHSLTHSAGVFISCRCGGQPQESSKLLCCYGKVPIGSDALHTRARTETTLSSHLHRYTPHKHTNIDPHCTFLEETAISFFARKKMRGFPLMSPTPPPPH